jgi:hypothetical protein
VLGWFTTNNLGHYKRAVAIAALYTIEGTGSFLGTYTFTNNQAPKYVVGFAICMGAFGVSLIFTWVYTFSLWWENRARRLGKRDYLRSVANQEELGDRHVLPSIEKSNE